MKLADRFRDVFAADPQGNAIEYRGTWYSWSEILELALRINRRLDASGIPAGAPVGVLVRNRPVHVATYVALVLSERTIVTLNPMQPASVLAEDMAGLRLPCIVAEAEDWNDALTAAAKDAGSAGITLGAAVGDPVGCVAGLETPGSGPHRTAKPGTLVEMLTSGTTGKPKRIPIRTGDFAKSLGAGIWSKDGGAGIPAPTPKKSASILFVPLLHISGFYRCLFAIFECRPMVLLEKFAIEPWREAMRQHRPKNLGLPPTALRMILDADVPKEELASVLAVNVGTAPLDQATRKAFEDRYGIPVLCNYGATEFLGPVASWTLADRRHFGDAKEASVGRAVRGVALRIIDPATGAEAAEGGVGLLEVRADRLNGGDGWVRTTDLASIDADGFLYLHGRADGAIIRGGFKVLPEVVARTLQMHPDVKEAAVAGIADERLGAVPVAAVELVPGRQVTAEELLRFARQHLTAYQIPVALKIIPELPRTPSMKVALPAVRELFDA